MKKFYCIILILFVGIIQSSNAQEMYFNSDGVKIRFVQKGSGSPVILIHGFMLSSDYWSKIFFPGIENIMDTLAKNHQVIALDCRGHGKSDKPHGSTEYGLLMVKDVINLMDFLNIPKAYLLGYSMGASIVNNLELRYPNRVISAVLASGGSATKEELNNEIDSIQFIWLKTQNELLKGENPISLFRWLGLLNDNPQHDSQVLSFTKMVLNGQDRQALASVLAGFPQLFDISENARQKNEIPTLVIGGELDHTTRFLKKYSQHLKHSEFIEVKGADHSLFFNNVAVDTIVLFINSH